MPANDKDGIILDTLQLNGSHVYVVGFKDKPHLRISVKPENVRNWVSERTHEQWDRDQVQLMKDEEQRIRDENRKPKKGLSSREGLQAGGKGKAGQKRKRAASTVKPPPAKRASVLGSTPNLPPPSGPGRRRKPAEEEPVFASPKASQKSQGPSLSTPVKGLAYLDTDEDDEMDESAAIAFQLNGSLGRSRSTTGTSRRSSRDVSHIDDNSAVASISSRAALQTYEDLDARSKKPNAQTIAQKYSKLPSKTFSPRAGMFSPPKDHKPPSQAGSPSKSYQYPHANANAASTKNPASLAREYGVDVEEDAVDFGDILSEEDDSEAEFEVDKILDDDMRKGVDGKLRLHYLIKWVGSWDDSWEPVTHVGQEAIKEYNETKARKSIDMRARVEDASDSDGNEMFVTDRKWKGKGKAAETPRGQVIDDDNIESD